MATQKAGTTAKKSAPKKTTSRGPTKASALKALGLTQEDLDAIKELREVREQIKADHAQTVERDAVGKQTERVSEPTIKPDEGKSEVPAQTGWFMRNLREVDVRFRLTRQQDRGKKGINLNPRGRRGDMKKLEDGDLEDSELRTQEAYGLIEIIPAAEAIEILRKQGYNSTQQQVHPAVALLRNPEGYEYPEGAVQLDPEYNSQGIVVASVDPAIMAGQLSDKEIGRQPLQPRHPSMGGNPAIISDGSPAAQAAQIPVDPRDAGAAQADAVARNKNLQGPGAGLGHLNVTVNPVQKG